MARQFGWKWGHGQPTDLQGISRHVPVRLLGTRFKAKNCISEPRPQEPYREILAFDIPLLCQN
jgi:hypothetical protein